MSCEAPVCISLASFPGKRHADALMLATELAACDVGEPALGKLSVDHVQLVPQNMGMVDDGLVQSFLACAPATRFRLHANVRVMKAHRMSNLSSFNRDVDWFTEAARVSKLLKAPAYTAHSGLRKEATMAQLLDNARRCADLFECPVGVEGQYPNAKSDYMVSTWGEYRTLFESGVPYALDLSHINILAHHSKDRNEALLSDMLACERCIEVHVSENNGIGDWHQVCESKPWWFKLLPNIHASAVVFTEGNHLRSR